MLEGDVVRVKDLLPKHQNPKKLPYLEYYEDYVGRAGIVMYVSKGYDNILMGGTARLIAIVKFKDGKELCFEQEELEPISLVDFYSDKEWNG